MKKKWYLIRCNYGKIDLGQKSLEAMGVECFCPRLSPAELKILFDNKKSFSKGWCIFPPYLFVRFDIDHIPISKIQHAIGVKGFVRFGGGINSIPDIVIGKIMKNDYLSGIDKDVIKLIRCENKILRVDALLSMIESELGKIIIGNKLV
uniref:transcription termination/antitermination NusG family protein n=1 Tax=Serratia proteamaculans TaxID=28151 RepID=UPI001F4BECE8|nr:transcription termination/antitermination NusG family protein [Serratia proteamaculans]ULG13678.1 AnfA1 [Serratia proteamaculans]ULG15129.1 AnfA1 [Serratia proteamaculans]ULG16365.1 AnfA1 [Serratia proteamaculans]ULG19438.1 AnfA1 [Serratia proteamaculans]